MNLFRFGLLEVMPVLTFLPMGEGQPFLSTAPLDSLVHPTPSLPLTLLPHLPILLLTVLAIGGKLRGIETDCVLLGIRLLRLKPLLQCPQFLQCFFPKKQLQLLHQLLLSSLHHCQKLPLFQSLFLTIPQ